MTAPITGIVVDSNRQWYLNSRSGTFIVTLDGKRVGAVAPVDRLEVPCTPGTHVLRIRQWWFRSSATPVEVADGSRTRIEVDDPSQRPFLKSWVTGMITPWRALSLSVGEAQPGVSEVEPRTVGSNATEGARRTVSVMLVAVFVLSLLGFSLLLVAVEHKVLVLAVVAGVLIALGLLLGTLTMWSVRRK